MKVTLSHRLSVIFLKYIVVIAALIMYIHNILLLTNLDLQLADYTISLTIFPAITAMTWSKAFGFCRLHRCFIAYTCLMSYCIKYQEDFGFGNLLAPARQIMFVIGTILFAFFLTKVYNCKDVCNKSDIRQLPRKEDLNY